MVLPPITVILIYTRIYKVENTKCFETFSSSGTVLEQ